MNIKEEEIHKLMDSVKSDIESDNIKEAGDKIRKAIEIASDIGNKELQNEIVEYFKSISYSTKLYIIELTPIITEGFILDIGGGGEGIIGKLNGRNVIAIDKNKQELLESQNKALKIVMDATDLKFLPRSFDVCTTFFSLMYIPINHHVRIFEEISRILDINGRLLIWDVEMPEKNEDYKTFIVNLKVKLLNEEVPTGYGVMLQKQNLEYFERLAKKTNFKISNEWKKGEIFHLELVKEK